MNVNRTLSLTNVNLEGNLSSDSSMGWKEWARMDGCAALQGQLGLWSGLGSAWCIFLGLEIDSLRLSWFLCLGLFMFYCMYFFTGCSLWFVVAQCIRGKRPNCFISSGPTQSWARKSYSYLTLMYMSFLSHLIADQRHKYELKLCCFQTTQI